MSEEFKLPEWDEKEQRPESKMPICPRCDRDELGMIHAYLTVCYWCGLQICTWIDNRTAAGNWITW